jgi:hypothetical protein
MSSRLSVWRVAAVLAGLALPGVLLWSACSIPSRESSPDKISPCVEGCPVDASIDGQADASQTGRLDQGAQGVGPHVGAAGGACSERAGRA